MESFFVRIFLFYLISIFISAQTAEATTSAQTNQIGTVDAFSQHCRQDLDKYLPDTLYAQSIKYYVDPEYDTDELSLITGLHEQQLITKKDVACALFYLKQMGVFKDIVVKICHQFDSKTATNITREQPPEKQYMKKYDFEFHLTKHAIFSQLTITGPLRSKERYKNAYLIDIGDVFDIQKHNHSLQAIHKIFHEQGYFQAQIIDNMIKNPHNASIAVKLSLKKGARFTINKIDCTVDGTDHISQTDTQKTCQKITDLCTTKLHTKPYSHDLIKSIRHKIKSLLEHKGFMIFNIAVQEKVCIENQTIDLSVHITIDRKKEFIFLGNSFFKHQQILDHLLLYGKSAWHFPSSVIIDEIVQFYKSKGFWNVRVSLREEKDKVFCLISEGSRIIISHVQLKDNDTLPPAALIKNNFSQLLKAKFFDKELLKKSTEQLLKTYKQAGFWDVKIVKEDFIKRNKENNITWSPDRNFAKASTNISNPTAPTIAQQATAGRRREKDNSYTLALNIEPGRKRIMGNVTIPEYENIQDEFTLFYQQQLLKGFDNSLLLEQKQWLTRYLRNQGYQKISIDYLLRETFDSISSQDLLPEKAAEDIKIVDVIWNISLHESEVKFGKTIILGNCMVPYSSIMREVCYKPGENWDKQKIELTLKNLKELNIFESIQIYPCQNTDEFLYKPIFMKLIHADRYEVRTRFGLQQVGKNLQLRRGFTYKVGGSFYLKNLFNIADQGFIEADITKFYRNIAASYEFPWLLGRRIRCQFKIYDSLYQQPVYIGSKNSLYTATQQGFLWNMSHAFPSVTISGSTGIEFMGIKEADQPKLGAIIDYDPQLLDKKPAYLFCEPNIIWQKVDNLLNPRRGHLSLISCKGMFDLDSKTSLFKLLVEHSQYTPVSEHITLALRLRGGHVFNRCFNQLIPIERFYLGGASSLRGYERDYCPPFGNLTEPIYDQHAGLPPQADNLWRYGPQGGRTMVNLNTEVRFSIYNNLGGAIFTDAGALFKHSIYDECNNKSDNLFAGSGFGIRYDTPIGPLRFDCAFKWKRSYPDFESWCVWYLTLGQAF